MKPSLFTLLLAVAILNCRSKVQPAIPTGTTNDTALVTPDTAFLPTYSEEDHLRDSLETKHMLDSFHAIKPLAYFRDNDRGTGLTQLIASLIDTTDVTRIPLAFTDTTLYTYDKEQNPVSERTVLKSKRFTVEVLTPDVNEYTPRKIFINGRALRPGKEIDTSLSGSSYASSFAIFSDEISMLQFGRREYLLLSGHIYQCNGMGCRVSYHLLYDPSIGKAMLLEQYGSDFMVGYDRKNDRPVFFDMGDYSYNEFFKGYFDSGKAYYLDRQNKIHPMLNDNKQHLQFEAFSANNSNSTLLLSSNFPAKK